ncbi:uncharacterized protein [Ptychodera flava]|uniref:uncharacterized protein n=1 Tax=Ptychodera flava TaxID=63121 RepID=UPI003969EE67
MSSGYCTESTRPAHIITMAQSVAMDPLQQKAMSAALLGHSFFLTGQAGSGKTKTLIEIVRALRRVKKKVQVTASTGMAATQLAEFRATTLHKFACLLDGRFNDAELISHVNNCSSTSMVAVWEKIRNMDTLVIDEVSMVSAAIFLQVDLVIRTVRKSTKPFGGVQCIVCGDFRQLPPVPNTPYKDYGHYVFETGLFKDAIPHVITLSTIHRQRDEDLIQAVHELSNGTASECTLNLMNRLSRPLPPGNPPTLLYGLNYDVNKTNSDRLLDMPGSIQNYKAIDSGETRYLKAFAAPQNLYLKRDAPVMLTVNLSEELVNGLIGKVVDFAENGPRVHFESISMTTLITPYTFSKYDPEMKKNVTTRQQIPLTLAQYTRRKVCL